MELDPTKPRSIRNLHSRFRSNTGVFLLTRWSSVIPQGPEELLELPGYDILQEREQLFLRKKNR